MNNKNHNHKHKVEIVNFNDMVNPQKEGIKKLDPEESDEIRKKLTRLLFIVLLFGIIILIITFSTNNLKSKEKKETKKEEEPVVEEENKEIPTGNIDINNDIIKKYKNLLVINSYDMIFNPSLKNVFNNINTSSLDNSNKLYFASKSETFQNFIEKAGLSNHQYQCNGAGNIEIDASIMQNAMEEVFGSGIVYQNADFYYPYYVDGTLINVYKLTFVNGKYTMTCINKYSTNANMVVQSKFEMITNDNNQLTFNNRVVFITKNGVFMDPQTKVLITKDPTVVYDTYIKKGKIYKFIFSKNNGEYYFSRIEVQNQ